MSSFDFPSRKRNETFVPNPLEDGSKLGRSFHGGPKEILASNDDQGFAPEESLPIPHQPDSDLMGKSVEGGEILQGIKLNGLPPELIKVIWDLIGILKAYGVPLGIIRSMIRELLLKLIACDLKKDSIDLHLDKMDKSKEKKGIQQPGASKEIKVFDEQIGPVNLNMKSQIGVAGQPSEFIDKNMMYKHLAAKSKFQIKTGRFVFYVNPSLKFAPGIGKFKANLFLGVKFYLVK